MADRTKLEVIVEAVDMLSAPSVAMRKRLEELGKAASHIGNATGISGIAKQFGKVGASFGNVKREAKDLLGTVAKIGALGAAGAYVFNEQLLKPAMEIEDTSRALTTLMGSSTAAKKATEWIEQFAIDTPADLKETASAFIALQKQGLDPTTGLLQAISDTAITTGASLEDVTAIIGKAARGIPVKDLAKITGISANLNKATGAVQYSANLPGGKKYFSDIINSKDANANTAALTAALNAKYAGAGKEFDKTLRGSLDNIGDAWEIFRRRIMDAGLFKFISENAKMVADRLAEMLKTGELQKWADVVGTEMLNAAKAFVAELPNIITAIKDIASATQSVVKFFGGWGNAIKIVAALMVGKFVFSLGVVGKELAILGLKVLLSPFGPLLLEALAVTAAITAVSFAIAWVITKYQEYARTMKENKLLEHVAGLSTENMSRAHLGREATFGESIGMLAPPANPLDVSRGAKDSGGKIQIELKSDVPMSIYKAVTDFDNMHVGTTTAGGLS